MRIVFVNPVAILGGAERVLLNLFRPLRAALPGVEQALVTAANGPLVEEARGAGLDVEVVSMPERIAELGTESLSGLSVRTVAALVPQIIAYRARLGRALNHQRPSIVHSNGLKTHLLTTRITTAPVVWHVHDFLRDRGRLVRPLQLSARIGSVAAAIANSEAVATDARALFPRLPVNVVYNAVDTEHHHPGAPDAERIDHHADETQRPPRDALRIGLVATYARWKGHLLFLDAASQLAPADERLRFYIVGGPVYSTSGSQFTRGELEREAARRNLQGRVIFVPFQRDTSEVYRALDIVVHASTRREPFGMTIAEAMANGRAVVVSRDGGAAELFTEGVDALGFTPGNVAELTAVISRLTADASLRASLGAVARRSAVDRFALPRFAAEIARIYRQIAPKS